jgi:hypothetical protein
MQLRSRVDQVGPLIGPSLTWVAASGLGGVLVGLGISAGFVYGDYSGGAAIGFFSGAFFGLPQSLVLARARVPHAWGWVVITGGAFAAALSIWLMSHFTTTLVKFAAVALLELVVRARDVSRTVLLVLEGAFFMVLWLVPSAIVSGMQATFIADFTHRARWWGAVATLGGLPVTAAIGQLLYAGFDRSASVLHGMSGGGAAGLAYGLVTAVPLAWLLICRRMRTHEPDTTATESESVRQSHGA